MDHLSTVNHGCPIAKLRFHPERRLLASVAGPRAEVCVWGWDESGALDCLARIVQAGATRVRDVAWHPSGDALAIVSAGKAIEVWSVPGAEPVREYGDRPTSARTVVRGNEPGIHYPLERQGYKNVIFSAAGDLIVAGGTIDRRTEVYRVGSGQRIDTFWPSDTTFALHPEGEILATITSNQVATAVRFGGLTDRFQGFDAQLNLPIDGYQRLVFSPRGDAFAVMGHAYGVGIRIYEFPMCQTLFELDFEKWKDVRERLWGAYQGSGRYTARPDGGYPVEFLRDHGTITDRLAFHPDGRSLLIGTIEGRVVGIGLEDRTKPSGIWTAHDGPLLALDVSGSHALLATARHDGEIKLWRLDGAATPPLEGKPMTEAFLDVFRPIDSMAPEDQFCTTDGRRWYDAETIGHGELDEDAPAWAQIWKLMRRGDGPVP